MEKELTVEEKFERQFESNPKRYVAVRTKKGELIEVHDTDSGYTHIKSKSGEWFAID